jgi:O-antigen ligase
VPYETAEYLLTLAGYAAVLLLLRDFTLRGSRRSWPAVWPLLIIGGIEAILGLYQASASPNAFATGTYASRDHSAGLLEMIFPFAVTYPLAILQREERQFTSPLLRTLAACGLLGLAIVLLAAIIQSLCRMAFLASLAALFVVAMLTLASRRSSGDSKGPSGWRKLRPAATVAAVLLLGFLVLQTDAMMGRFTELASSDKVSADARGEIWRNTVDLIKAFPLFGCGLGGYQSGLLRFQTVAPLKTVNYAHNDYLQVQAEMGIVGLLVGLLFVGRLLQQTVAGVRKAPSVEERYLAIACAASMTAMLLHSLVDFNMYVPANGMVFAWVAGIACTYARPRIPARPED